MENENDQLVTFFDPHPGLMGCPVRLQESVRLAASGLDGVTCKLSEGLKRLEGSLTLGQDAAFEVHEEMITLSSPGEYDGKRVQNCWRVIRFKTG